MNKKPLVLLFDANPLVNGVKSGVGYYTQNLIQALAKNYPEEVLLVGHYFSFLGRKDKLALPKASNIYYVRSRIIPGKILSVTRLLGFQLPLELFFKRSGDAVLFTNFVCLPSITNIPRLVAVHDLCFIDVPQYVAKKNRRFLQKFVPRSIKSSSRIITISNATKKAIERQYNTDDKKFIITPIPPLLSGTPTNSDLSKFNLSSGYILFVSNLEPRKNLIGLVKGYENLPAAIKKQYPLVIVGGRGWNIDDTMAYIAKLKDAGENIIITGYVSDDEKATLYANATVFIMPSHYEGFGMPILEAMDYGVATLVSSIDVFHEVAGDASMYFDKDSPADLSKKLEQLLRNEKARHSLIKKGNQRLKMYNWDDVAKNLYNELVKL